MSAIGAPPAPGQLRIGVAINIPQPWGEALTRRRADAGDAAAEFVPAHITLLGPTDIAAELLPQVEAHLAAVATAHPPYPLHLRGTGTFRPITDVVFVAVAAGISECELLAASISSVDELVRNSPFPYHPHVTVAQNVPAEALDKVYDDLAGFEAHFDVDAFTLFSHSGEGCWLPYRDFPLGG